MDNLLQKNLDALETTTPDWKDAIQKTTSHQGPDYQIFNEIELHREGRSPLIVLMGVENIEALRTIREDLRRYTAVIAEPDLSRLKHLLSNQDLTELVQTSNIVFVAGDQVDRIGDELEMYFSIAMIDHIKTIKPIDGRQREFQQAFQNLNEFHQSAETNRSTVEKFLTDWYIYFAQNLKTYVDTPSLSAWDDALAGDTVTIVGPGPSIDNEVDTLKQLAEGWIVALDTAVPLLNQLDISPDIIVSVDVGEDNQPFLEDYPEGAHLVCPSYMDPSIIDQADTSFLFETRFPPNQWISRDLESPGYLPLSGSVSSAAIGLVRMLNPSECYLLGLDLSAPGFISHSRRLPDYKRMLSRLSRFQTIPGNLYQQLKEKHIQTVETPSGTVTTTAQYLHWKEAFEVMIKSCSCPFYRMGRKILPVQGARTTRRIHEFNKKKHGELPVNREDRIADRSRFKRRINSLAERIRALRVELETIGSKIRRDLPIQGEWLQFAGQLGENGSFLSYFRWEIDRITQELQQAENPEKLEETAQKQYSRWKSLLEETEQGLKQLP